MTKELTIEEGNKLIAEFMGFDFAKSTKEEDYCADSFTREWRTREVPLTVDDLEYNTSWDWLMSVVEKINTTRIPDNEFPASVIIYRTTCHVNDDTNIIVETTSKGSLIECVWQACVQFIQWYNSQNS